MPKELEFRGFAVGRPTVQSPAVLLAKPMKGYLTGAFAFREAGDEADMLLRGCSSFQCVHCVTRGKHTGKSRIVSLHQEFQVDLDHQRVVSLVQ